MKANKGKVPIPQGNIDTYLHWYNLLKEIQKTPFDEPDFTKELDTIRKYQRRFDLPDEWLWTGEKHINVKAVEMADLLNPFRQVWHHMKYGQEKTRVLYKDLYPNTPNTGKGSLIIRNYGKKREGPPVKSWAFNVLLSALVEDAHWYGKGGKFAETVEALKTLRIKETNDYDYDSLRKHYRLIDQDDIMHLLKVLHGACTEKGESFIPSDVSISEWPVDFLANIAHDTGVKPNPYLSRNKHMTDQDIEALPAHLKKRLQGRK